MTLQLVPEIGHAEASLQARGRDRGNQDPFRRQLIFKKRLEHLRRERQDWVQHWKEISDYLLPRRGRFLADKPNRGVKINQNIVDSSATFALRTLASGIMSGLTSPSRPWFRLTTQDLELREVGPIKIWLHEVQLRMEQIFANSNLYKVLPTMYEEMGAFGSSAMIVQEDVESVIRCMSFPVGSYFLANGPSGQVGTFYREFSMTVIQLVEQFGVEKVSPRVQRLYEIGNTEDWVEVVHLIEPNDDRVVEMVDNRNMPWRSAWFEKQDDKRFLRESGYLEFPIMAPRWWLNGEDIYGRSPGMDALGDIKQLQHEQKRKSQALDKIVNPPMTAPSALKTGGAGALSQLPGGVSYVDSTTGQPGFRPAYEVPPAVAARREEIAEVQRRISRQFYEDLFLMLANTDRREITAREVEEKHEEKLLQLGPVLERMKDELHDPLIDRTFAIMLRNGLVPTPPAELQGQQLKVEYISILAQAQRSVGNTAMERMLAQMTAVAQLRPEALDKIDWDQWVDEVSSMLGLPPSVVLPDDVVTAVREARERQLQLQQRLAATEQLASSAKQLGDTEMSGDTALNRVGEALRQRASSSPPEAQGGT